MKAILLARVSNVEQEDTHSIPAQLERIQDYSRNKNLDVIEVFQITESSTKDTRKKFEKIIEAIKKSKEPIALVVETVDRLQRSFKESIVLNDFVQEGKLAIHFLRENLIVHKDSNSSDHMRWDMAVMFAKSYVMQLSDNVKRSFQRKLKQGEWPREAPLGYINYRDEKDNSCIEPDPERAALIRKMFELYASGNHSMITLVTESQKMGLTTKKGKTLAVSTIERMLKNSFYHGYMSWDGFYGPHKYERLITKELFDKCTAVREGWHKKPTKYAAKPFIFRGIIQCKVCNSTITAQIQKKKYIYYHCSKRTCPQHHLYTKEEALLKEVEKVFKALGSLPKEVIDDIVQGLKSACHASSDFHMDSLKALQTQYEKYEKRKSALYDEKLDGSITHDFYDKKFKEYTDKQADIQQQMQEHNKANNTIYITASLVLDLAKRAWEIFESSETPEKRAFINFLLQNCNLNDKNLEYNLKEPFNTILQHSMLPLWQSQ
jgi:site-specific DNA recombinase